MIFKTLKKKMNSEPKEEKSSVGEKTLGADVVFPKLLDGSVFTETRSEPDDYIAILVKLSSAGNMITPEITNAEPSALHKFLERDISDFIIIEREHKSETSSHTEKIIRESKRELIEEQIITAAEDDEDINGFEVEKF